MSEREVLKRKLDAGFIGQAEYEHAMLALDEALASVSAGDERLTRLRALYDRIGALPDEALAEIERTVLFLAASLREMKLVLPEGMTVREFQALWQSVTSHGGKVMPVKVLPGGVRIEGGPVRRADLDRMTEAIHALPDAPTMGRAIGA